MREPFGIIGRLKILKYEKEKLIEEYEFKNLITDIGLDYLLKLIGGDISGGINKLAIGSGLTPASKSDISLTNKLLLLDVTKDYTVSGRINFITKIAENTFSDIVNYNEAGLTFKTNNTEILVTRLLFSDTIFQKPENSLSLLYSLELQV
jgi:hypothetical protein